MFKFILVVVLTTNGKPAPEPIATFKTERHCEAVAFIINEGFRKQGATNKALCIDAMKWEEV